MRSAKNFIVQNMVSAGTLSGRPLPPPRPEQNRFLGMEKFLQDKWDRIVKVPRKKIADNRSASVSGREAPH